MKDLDFLTKLTGELLKQNIDYEVTLKGYDVTVEMFDMGTNTTIGVVKSDSLEAGLAVLMSKFTASSRNVKVFDDQNKLTIKTTSER